MDLEIKLQKFQQTSREEQINICIKILSVAVKKWNKKVVWLLKKIQSWNVVSKTLDMVYLNFLKAHTKTQEQKRDQELWKYERGQKYIKVLKGNEERERELEQLDLENKLGELLVIEKKGIRIIKEKKSGLRKAFIILFIITFLVLAFFYRDILINYIQWWLSK